MDGKFGTKLYSYGLAPFVTRDNVYQARRYLLCSLMLSMSLIVKKEFFPLVQVNKEAIGRWKETPPPLTLSLSAREYKVVSLIFGDTRRLSLLRLGANIGSPLRAKNLKGYQSQMQIIPSAVTLSERVDWGRRL